MTNEDIIDKNTPLEMVVFEYKKTLELMELARQDEREKMRGVDCWISWATFNTCLRLTSSEQECYKYDGGVAYFGGKADAILPESFAGILGLKEGQCKKVRIVEINEPNQLTTEAT